MQLQNHARWKEIAREAIAGLAPQLLDRAKAALHLYEDDGIAIEIEIKQISISKTACCFRRYFFERAFAFAPALALLATSLQLLLRQLRFDELH
jgi:hypothetical protein